ncbi:hypothetical protein EVAR_78394_1 [Eumeta japonica]|uniref:Uncharacterized protein n=1 Tax=Eumeta variegata TaxID=151549 RepID=A0A4C1T643_EUMVA|nr:hypothetical protein EVAR_78394_1 [Eumeta japonica]
MKRYIAELKVGHGVGSRAGTGTELEDGTGLEIDCVTGTLVESMFLDVYRRARFCDLAAHEDASAVGFRKGLELDLRFQSSQNHFKF